VEVRGTGPAWPLCFRSCGADLQEHLDEGTRDDIMTLLEYLWHELGITLVVVTHDTSVARWAQRTGVMNDGRLTIQPMPVGGYAPGAGERPGSIPGSVRRLRSRW
jgi:energy-coupling factor transporter ATP-binding protein EcfA2